jgi:hypothetical protein
VIFLWPEALAMKGPRKIKSVIIRKIRFDCSNPKYPYAADAGILK